MVITIPKIYAVTGIYETWGGTATGEVQTPSGPIHPFSNWEGGVHCSDPQDPYELVDGKWVDKSGTSDSVWGTFAGHRKKSTNEVTGTWTIEGGTRPVPVGEGGEFSGIWPHGGGQVQNGVWWCTGNLTGNGTYKGSGYTSGNCD